jgi:hypothetical protein
MKLKISETGALELTLTIEEDEAAGKTSRPSAIMATLATVLAEKHHIKVQRWIQYGRSGPPPAFIDPTVTPPTDAGAKDRSMP